MNDAGKVAFTPKGAYSSTVTYEYLDTVVHDDGNAYAAKKITTGNAPADPENEYWVLLARGGNNVPSATNERAGIVKLAYHEDITEPGTHALDAVQANTRVRGTLAHQVLQHDVDLLNKLSRNNISSSSAVTESSMYVLDAREKNASISGTLASQIEDINTKLVNVGQVEILFDKHTSDTVANPNQYSENLTLDKYKYIYVELVYGGIAFSTSHVPKNIFTSRHYDIETGIRLIGIESTAVRVWYDGGRLGVTYNTPYWVVRIWGII